jgi:UDPglucose 6-dehydrogenase
VEPAHEQRPRLTVIGTGHLGATHAVCMAELGFEVLGLDVVPEKVEALQSGRVPFFEQLREAQNHDVAMQPAQVY